MRNSHWTSRVLAMGVVAFATMLGCASSQLVNMWKDPEHPKKPIDHMLVISVRKDATLRRVVEDSFIAELSEIGVRAEPSYRPFANAVPDTQQVVDYVREKGFNGVLVAVPLGTETQENYVPGYVTTVPAYYGGYSGYGGYGYGGHYGGYWGSSYYPAYQTVYEPGYVETTQIVRLRVDVWSTDQGGLLVWTGTTETFNPTSSDQLRSEVLRLIIPELEKKGIIVSK